ncbi:MAG: beta galactosidase jelly roll domain-containing protein, partial [Oscillospiraceae bacterium]
MLYPKLNRARMVLDLGGVWDFQTAGADQWPHEWAQGPLPQPMTMAVPASYNDQKDDVNLRAHYGWAVYQRTFDIPEQVMGQRLWLRFGAVTHAAQVWIDETYLGEHKGGFLPFEFELTNYTTAGEHRLTVAVDNRVDFSTLPVGNEGGVAFFGSDNPGIPSIELAKTRCKPQN